MKVQRLAGNVLANNVIACDDSRSLEELAWRERRAIGELDHHISQEFSACVGCASIKRHSETRQSFATAQSVRTLHVQCDQDRGPGAHICCPDGFRGRVLSDRTLAEDTGYLWPAHTGKSAIPMTKERFEDLYMTSPSTYIANAAISSAKIADATITDALVRNPCSEIVFGGPLASAMTTSAAAPSTLTVKDLEAALQNMDAFFSGGRRMGKSTLAAELMEQRVKEQRSRDVPQTEVDGAW